MKLTFAGAASEVTGSNHILEIDGNIIVIDCGMFQGEHWLHNKNFDAFPYDPKAVKAVFLTHAHLDHSGRLPKLVKEGFAGKIYSTAPTKELAEIVMMDAAGVMSEDHHDNVEKKLLYTDYDVVKAVSLFQTVEYGEPIVIGSATITLKDAGHILGSSFAEITTPDGMIAFSGDLGNSPMPLMNEPEKLAKVDYIVSEATYGDTIHESGKTRAEYIKEGIEFIKANHGTMMIPAFALERTQEILYELNALAENDELDGVPIFLDSPMAIEATKVFKKYIRFLNEDSQEKVQEGDNVFEFKGLTTTSSREQSRRINHIPGPKIIIAGSGMMHGGRIMHHLVRYLSDPNSYLLIVGYQVEGTLGRQILDGERRVKIFDELINVKAKIVNATAFSGHADKQQLLNWLSPAYQTLEKVFLIHSEKDKATAFAQLLKEKTSAEITIPEVGQSYELKAK